MDKELEEKIEKFIEGIEKYLPYFIKIESQDTTADTKEMAQMIYQKYFGDDLLIGKNFDKNKNKLILEAKDTTTDPDFFDKLSYNPWCKIAQYIGCNIEIKGINKCQIYFLVDRKDYPLIDKCQIYFLVDRKNHPLNYKNNQETGKELLKELLEEKIEKFIEGIEVILFSDDFIDVNLSLIDELLDDKNKTPKELAILFYNHWFSSSFKYFDLKRNKLVFEVTSMIEYYNYKLEFLFYNHQWNSVVNFLEFGIEIQIIDTTFTEGIASTHKRIICLECDEDYENNQLEN